MLHRYALKIRSAFVCGLSTSRDHGFVTDRLPDPRYTFIDKNAAERAADELARAFRARRLTYRGTSQPIPVQRPRVVAIPA